MDYYCQSRLGLLALVRNPEVPTAVELCLNGKSIGHYVSADVAARVVASRLTENKRLNALPDAELPATLRDWQQSATHHFKV